MTLLAKQAWRLLHDEGTFFYRIFKARFFPHCSFMEAKELATSSYAWKSILKGREVIQMGARFRVGKGKNIKIWQHHWLPIKHPPLVSSPIIESMEDATVDCLIDNNTGKWDAEMLKGVLILAEAELVQRIPLPRCQTDDTLYWPFTADGQYNCKSGYKFLKDLEENSEDGSHLEVDKNLWKTFGPYTSQTNTRTCCGVHAETLFHRSKTCSGERFYNIPAVTVAPYKQRILCMLCGVARA